MSRQAWTPPEATWDPRDDGAKCDQCPLGPKGFFSKNVEKIQKHRKTGHQRKVVMPKLSGWRPVPAEHSPTAIGIGVAQSPGPDEELALRPLVGPAGNELMRAEEYSGKKRPDLSLTNVIACQPPDDFETMLYRIQLHNQRIKKATPKGEQPQGLLEDPRDCCRPRLLKDVGRYRNVLLMGKPALQSFLGDDANISKMRGCPVPMTALIDGEVRHFTALATVNSAMVLRQKEWRKTFRQDVERAFRLFNGQFRWTPAIKIVCRDPQQLEDFLYSRQHIATVVDYETSIEDSPLWARVKCVGMGDDKIAMILPVSGTNDPLLKFMSDDALRRCMQILAKWLADTRYMKWGWNGYFERLVSEAWLGVVPWPMIDWMLGHKAVDNEMPHDLFTAGSTYHDVPPWKAKKTAEQAESDEELWDYNGDDVCIEYKMGVSMEPQVTRFNQTRVVHADHFQQAACAGLHKIGIGVNQERRQFYENKYASAYREWTQRFKNIAQVGSDFDTAGAGDFNCRSFPQLVELLYRKWKLPIYRYTDKGEPSTDDECIIKLSVDNEVPARAKAALRALRFIRKADKKIQFIRKCRPRGSEYGTVWSDGRLHTSWNAHAAVSGRLSSSDPLNLQTIEMELRDMIEAAPGHVFVQADYDALELRVITALAQIRFYLEMFKNKDADPHDFLAAMAWKDVYTKAEGTKKTGQKGRMRDVAKRVQYGGIFWAEVATIHQQIREAENDDEELVYADAPEEGTQTVYKEWLALAPELPVWWEAQLEFWRTHGYIEEAILGRRRNCANGESERSEIVNFPVQAGGRSLVILTAEEMIQEEGIGFGYAGPQTGLVLDTHDNLVFEVPESDAKRVQHLLDSRMTRRHPSMPGILFTAPADITYRLREPTCKHELEPGKLCGGYTDPRMGQWVDAKKVCKGH